ncbi:MAG TPA: hypothetical protein IAA54_05690 [Candidatus Gallacutalibacter pullicola]|uniref:Uncharacterized protein n=1 Tax=Candidatus Gallacutalibacter pullicola TaxID=2840830 RepID=A0A9D1J1C1_9FIRM|nr:hypothetical protein [Candidatus Gallacutalibacter pullicola]
MDDTRKAMLKLKENRERLTRQEVRTLKGQILSGNTAAAMKGLDKILSRRGV